jgi:hypothetical protein
MTAEEHQVAYQDVRDGPSIVITPGVVAIPEEFPRLGLDALSEEMRLIIDTAIEIYDRWLLSTVIIKDEQPRLLLTFKASVPQKAATLRVNLDKLSTEIASGLSLSVLRDSLNFLK